MRVIGLTGSLATGKTTVANMFAQLGAKVIDADKIAHALLKEGSPCYGKVVRTFGKVILRGKNIDRPKLADLVFADKRRLTQLESIIHPYVRRETKRRITKYAKHNRSAVIVLNVPLLFETRMDQMTDATVVVKAGQNTQIERAVKNLKLTKAEALRRIRAQMPLKDKIRKADFIIHNNGSLTDTKKQVKQIWEKL